MFGYKNIPKKYYNVVRSRNNGEYWVELYYNISDLKEAEELMEKEHKWHPSDLLKIVCFDVYEVESIQYNNKTHI